jgi:hypothetical protein
MKVPFNPDTKDRLLLLTATGAMAALLFVARAIFDAALR